MGFLAAIGTAILGEGATVGTATAVGALATAGIGASIYSAVSSAQKPKTPQIQPLPSLGGEQTAAAAEKKAETIAKEEEKKRRALRTKTILTSPQGILEQAPVARKTLLGE